MTDQQTPLDAPKYKSYILPYARIKCSATPPEKAPLVPPPKMTHALIKIYFIPN